MAKPCHRFPGERVGMPSLFKVTAMRSKAMPAGSRVMVGSAAERTAADRKARWKPASGLVTYTCVGGRP